MPGPVTEFIVRADIVTAYANLSSEFKPTKLGKIKSLRDQVRLPEQDRPGHVESKPAGKQALEEEMERDGSMGRRNCHTQAALPGATEQV